MSARTARRIRTQWEQSEPRILWSSRTSPTDATPSLSFEPLPGQREAQRRAGTSPADEALIAVYRGIVAAVLGANIATRYDSITDPREYRERMRTGIAGRFTGNLPGLNSQVLEGDVIPAAQNRIRGDIFELWCQNNLGVARPGPIFIISDKEKIKSLKRERIISDGAIGDALVDTKVRRSRSSPAGDSEAIRQMEGYAYILDQPVNRSIESQARVVYKGPFRSVIYIFNDKTLIPIWKPVLEETIGASRVDAQ